MDNMEIKLIGYKTGVVGKEGKNKGKSYKVLQTVITGVNDSSYVGGAVKEIFLMGSVADTIENDMVGEVIDIVTEKNFLTGYEEIVAVRLS